MNNNDILRRICHIFQLDVSKVKEIFKQAEMEVSESQVNGWLHVTEYPQCKDPELAGFLNGLINEKRGKKEGPQPVPEKKLTNNIIFTKLKIALNLKGEEVLDIMNLIDATTGKLELSSFFRKPDNKHYRVCKDDVLHQFLEGLQVQFGQK